MVFDREGSLKMKKFYYTHSTNFKLGSNDNVKDLAK